MAWACTRWPGKPVQAAGWLFVIGTLLFSGSLYALSVSGVRGLGIVTPFGGVALLAGWLCLLWAPYFRSQVVTSSLAGKTIAVTGGFGALGRAAG